MADRKRLAPSLEPDLYARGAKQPRQDICLGSNQPQGSSPSAAADVEQGTPAGPAGGNASSLGAIASCWAPQDPSKASRHAEQVRLRSLAPVRPSSFTCMLALGPLISHKAECYLLIHLQGKKLQTRVFAPEFLSDSSKAGYVLHTGEVENCKCH